MLTLPSNNHHQRARSLEGMLPLPPPSSSARSPKTALIAGKLIRLVKQYGVGKWAQIVEKLVGRAGKQCRERWHNHLHPHIKAICSYISLGCYKF
ncbi:hypothetical protein D8674_024813 [Pyrus ussuriensis x Pyrus communis]|uniref:Uncharacterized protein n=1 Tax=Pyrus ussuriensis x Pyrus communis TaxID=2448454 RepID=A0A5N5H8Z1_9ROSA|nr:hypothetical protein D8674_024813 [Pyrus ussuriensis x Pyrus communis]